MSEERFAYTGTKPCGCIVAIIVDDPRWKKDTAKALSGYIKSGLTITRVSMNGPAPSIVDCKCPKAGA